MIEFKAECGHTIRARDEDAGGTVRCSYCGKPANVPEAKGDELDFLFNDVKQEEAGPPRAKRGPRLFSRRRQRSGEFNPFATVLKMCYVALLLIIVIVVGRKFVIPLIKEGGAISELVAAKDPENPPPRERRPRRVQESPSPNGLRAVVKPGVLYVDSTPPGALVYLIRTSEAPEQGRIYRHDKCDRCPRGECKPKGDSGTFVVEVAMRIADPYLREYPGYRELRHELVDATHDGQRQRLVKDYFIPDGGEVLFDEANGQEYIVRQYREVTMYKGKSEGVRALFLPRILRENGEGFSVERLVQENIIPTEEKYSFDEEEVRSELELYGVPQSDWGFIVEALKRSGVIPYVTPDGKIRLFKIGIHTGWFAETVIRDASP